MNDEEYITSRGDIFITYPDELHNNNSHPQGVSEFIWLQLNLSETQGFLGLDTSYSHSFLNRLTHMNTHLFSHTRVFS